MNFEIAKTTLILDKERAIYLPEESLLVISDLHLGKAAHFRKAGLSVPNFVQQRDLLGLSMLLAKYEPRSLLINGDMFHSDYNSEFDEFATWKENYPNLDLLLAKGNHDGQRDHLYQQLSITVYENYQTKNINFIHDFTHHQEDKYAITGHIHPGVAVYNKAKQTLKLPCFYFGLQYGIMPAFSHFTGLQLIKPKTTDHVFALTKTKIIKI